MRSTIQETVLRSLAELLRPIVSLMLFAGVGYREFDAIARRLFVQVASKEYGLRGRPTNMSRISAMTGISRKEVSRLRESSEVLGQAYALSPASEVIHYWHHDPNYSTAPGEPRPLTFQGPLSFSTLVSRYAGDVPPGAVRAALCQAGTVEEEPSGLLVPRRRFFLAARLDEDLVRGICFNVSNLVNTAMHNARVMHEQSSSNARDPEQLFLERAASTNHISPEATIEFRKWVKREGVRFIEAADAQLGETETPKDGWTTSNQGFVGVGIYYYQPGRDR